MDAEVVGAWLDTSAEDVTSSLPVSGVASGEEGWALSPADLGSWACVSDSAASVAVDGANFKPVSPAPMKIRAVAGQRARLLLTFVKYKAKPDR